MIPSEYNEEEFLEGDDYSFNDYSDYDTVEEELEATYEGEDAIEISRHQGERMEFGFSFHAHEGDEGDESEDNGDLTDSMKQMGNRFNPNMSLGGSSRHDEDEIIDHMHFADGGDIGFAFGPDHYTDDSDEDY